MEQDDCAPLQRLASLDYTNAFEFSCYSIEALVINGEEQSPVQFSCYSMASHVSRSVCNE